jgi:hypothetical protein
MLLLLRLERGDFFSALDVNRPEPAITVMMPDED